MLDEGKGSVLCDDLGQRRVNLQFNEEFNTFRAYSLGSEIATGKLNEQALVRAPKPFKGLIRSVRVIPDALPSVLVQAAGKMPFIHLVIYSKSKDAVKLLVLSALMRSCLLAHVTSSLLIDGAPPVPFCVRQRMLKRVKMVCSHRSVS